MSGVIPRFVGGPVTYTVVEAVKGGQLVEARAGSKIGVAGAGSIKCLGIATRNARPPASANSVDADGFPVLSVDANTTEFVAVGQEGHWPVVFADAAAFGDPLVCAANGQVTPAGAAPDARTIIGKCTEPAGVAAGGTGLVKFSI